VQLSMRMWLNKDGGLRKLVKVSARSMSLVFPEGAFETWNICKQLLPHLRELLTHKTDDGFDLLAQSLGARNAVWYLYRIAEYRQAEELTRISMENTNKVLGLVSSDKLRQIALKDLSSSWNLLGIVQERQGDYGKSEATHRMVLSYKEAVIGPNHYLMLSSMSNLGSVLLLQAKYEEAEVLLRQSLMRKLKVYGLLGTPTLNGFRSLGRVLCELGKYKEAEAMQRIALECNRRCRGIDNTETLSDMNNLGRTLKEQEKYEEAESMYWLALRGKAKAYGADHVIALECLCNVAELYYDWQKYSMAYQLFGTALLRMHKFRDEWNNEWSTRAASCGSRYLSTLEKLHQAACDELD
jgi:tetratricopeptide (TPR) repeat protein